MINDNLRMIKNEQGGNNETLLCFYHIKFNNLYIILYIENESLHFSLNAIFAPIVLKSCIFVTSILRN